MYATRGLKLFFLFLVFNLMLVGTLPRLSQPVQASSSVALRDQVSRPMTTRTGAWLDEIVISEESSMETAISRLATGGLDVYAYGSTNVSLFQTVRSNPDLAYSQSYGSYNELSFNPSGPVFSGTGKLNPFAIPKIREAMNRLIDRQYIVQTIMGSLATAKLFPIGTGFPDYGHYLAQAQALETEYAYDLAQASADITAEMIKLGATKNAGLWYYDGQPVILIFLIRVEDERRQIGDYVANQLESIGFHVDRQYKTSSESAPIWMGSNPADGLWHIYTGGWITTAIPRTQEDNFADFYTPLGWPGRPLWDAYVNTPEFYNVAQRLYNRDYTTLAERDQLFTKALDLCLEDSNRVWLVDRHSYTVYRSGVTYASNLARGLLGSQLWPYTIRFKDQEGGQMRIATPIVFADPWNPVDGSNWIYDWFIQRSTQDDGLLSDPNSGLDWPQRIERAEVTVQQGLLVTSTLDWVDLSFAPTIEVPADAWVDWDAANQQFITAGQKFGAIQTAKVKSVVYYPTGLFSTVTWHDGSPLDLADFIMAMILQFDPGKSQSAIYQGEAWANQVNYFLTIFKGVKIISADPLVIETYSDNYQMDAELDVWTWWPNYGYGPGAWHNLAMGYRADAAGILAFTSAKANASGIQWMDFIAGDSLVALKNQLDSAQAANFVPYANTLGAYITSAEAAARYTNLQNWYTARGNFWLGTGPFYLNQVNIAQGSLSLRHFAAFPDPAGKWDRFSLAPPSLAINYDAGAPGSAFTFVGNHFPVNRAASIQVNGALLGTVPTTDSGIFTFTLTTLPATNEGFYIVTASVNPAGQTRFEISATEPLREMDDNQSIFKIPEGLVAFTDFLFLPLTHR